MQRKTGCLNKFADEQASAFILALWSLFILSIFAVGLGKKAYQDINLASYFQNQSRARYLVEAGVKKAEAMLKQDVNTYDSLNELWSTGRSSDKGETAFQDMKLGGGVYSFYRDGDKDVEPPPEDASDQMIYGITDEEGKVNINTASAETLENTFFFMANVDRSKARMIASSIVDWRDSDSSPGDGGAEDQYYQFLKKPYDCKDGFFQIPEEILLVKDITDDVFKSVRKFITIYGDGRVNINTADELILRSLGMDEVLAKKIVAYRKGGDQKTGTEDDRLFKDVNDIVRDLGAVGGLQQGESEKLGAMVTQGLFSAASQNYSVFIEAKVGRRLSRVNCVIHKEKGLQYWHEL